jgi:hypothetical protein
MKDTLRIRGNMFPGLDAITNMILKIERSSAANSMMAVMKLMLNSGYCSKEWK